MKLTKKIAGAVLAVMMLAQCIVMCAVGTAAASVADSGSIGSTLTWKLYSDGELVIDGTGDMPDWKKSSYSSYYSTAPWGEWKDDIKEITIGKNVTSIGDYAFYRCYNATKVRIPDSVETIGAYAFTSCSKLESVALQEGLLSVGNYAFSECTKLATAPLPEGLTTIGNYAFNNCKPLSISNIPDSVTTIGAYAFYNCDGLTDKVLPTALVTIGASAFEECDKLTGVAIPAGVLSVGDNAFLSCDSLTSATVLNKDTEFGYRVFKYPHADFLMYGYADSTAEVYAYENEHPFTVISEGEPEVVFSLDSLDAKAGSTLSIDLTLENTVLIDSVALFNLTFDADILTFEGFSDYEGIEGDCPLYSFDEEKNIITFAIEEPEVRTGKICSLLFKVSDTAANGTTEINMTSLVKCGSDVIASAVTPCTVTVRNYLLGDINGDEAVTIDDALLLFQNSMLPDFYPVDYPGAMDYTGDGTVDIYDALALFRYSMLPDVYPIA